MARTKIGSNATYTGTQPGLTIIGEHCYAYNTAPASEVTSNILEFTTGKKYIVGTIQLNANVLNTDPPTGVISTLLVSFNGSTVFVLKATSIDALTPATASCDILIPPLTTVIAQIDTNSNTATYLGSAVIVGRVYA